MANRPVSIMNVKSFVAASACFLAAWLAFTFVREVPREGYQRLGKGSKPLTAAHTPVPAKSADQVCPVAAIAANQD
jgi:hypothetical protein